MYRLEQDIARRRAMLSHVWWLKSMTRKEKKKKKQQQKQENKKERKLENIFKQSLTKEEDDMHTGLILKHLLL